MLSIQTFRIIGSKGKKNNRHDGKNSVGPKKLKSKLSKQTIGYMV
jgi:hypothetical protein